MESQALVSAILAKLPKIGKWQNQFIAHLIPLFMSIKGRINFMQMSRFGNYSMTTYRNQFDKPFAFGEFNAEHVRQKGSGYHAIFFDPSHIRKSGKHTFGKGLYWSGCDSSMKQGLEIGGIAVGDIVNHTAFHYEAVQTPTTATLKSKGKTLLENYADLLIERQDSLLQFSDLLAVDAYFSKRSFVDRILNKSKFKLISRLRDDAVMYYLFTGLPSGKRGRPQLYDGKIDPHNPNQQHLPICYQDAEIKIFSGVIYVKSLDRKVKISIAHYLDANTGKTKAIKTYFCTDICLSGWHIVKVYKLRFQIEFLYRDANQFAGLEQCQARSEQKLYYHFNMALTTVSIAKSVHYLSLPLQERQGFSMADVKTLYHNKLLLDRFFQVFAIDPNKHKNNPKVKELYNFGIIAA
jgi:hypothetical protein